MYLVYLLNMIRQTRVAAKMMQTATQSLSLASSEGVLTTLVLTLVTPGLTEAFKEE